MPRTPTEKHPIRDLRKIIGKTQCGFARTIGIDPGTLKRIENNTLPLSRKVAIRVQAETGINVEKLLGGKLRDELCRKYTPAFYRKWKDRIFHQNERIARKRAKALAWWIEVLLRASVVGSKRRLWQVLRALIESADECCSDFDLRSPVESILAKYKPVVKWNPAGLTPGELRQIVREQAREEKRFEKIKNRPFRVSWHQPTAQSSRRRRSAA